MAGFMDAYAKWADGWSKVIAEASVPQVRYEDRQAKDWVTARLDYALIAMAGYLLLCAFGSYKKGQDTAAVRAADKKAQAASGLDAAAWAAKKKADAAAKPVAPKMTFADLVTGFPTHLGKVLSDPIKALQTLHNVIQVSLSVFMAVSVVQAALSHNYGIVCNEFDVKEKEITWVTWVFYMSKLYDFVDTIFMVLRGKWQQFSFLHTYHHVSIFLTYWWVVNTAHTGDTWFPVLLNSVVHAVMYFYYLLTCFGYQPWWGKQLTMMQMTQFITMMTQGVFILYWDCPFPHPTATYYVIYIGSMLLLFLNFFISKYYSDAKKAAVAKKEKEQAAKLAAESKKDI